MKSKFNFFVSFSLVFLVLSSCKKEPVATTATNDVSATDILTASSFNVIQATYNDLDSKTSLMYDKIVAFQSEASEGNLTVCKQSWKDARAAWEQSEGFLFGPVQTNNIDPRIDTWPISFSQIDSITSSNAIFSQGYVDSLEDALKGFHPIEYLLFGESGNKTSIQFTTPQLNYLKALVVNLKQLTSQLANSWNPSTTNNYHSQFVNAGNGSTTYQNQKAAFEEIVNAMIGICDEVANGKISEPYTLQDPSLEESPFSSNSLTDFTNNIKSVQNIYLGKYTTDGKGLEDLVRKYNLSLDDAIKAKTIAAITALQNITLPFGEAIIQQPTQIDNAIVAINDLKEELENNLLPFVQQNVK